MNSGRCFAGVCVDRCIGRGPGKTQAAALPGDAAVLGCTQALPERRHRPTADSATLSAQHDDVHMFSCTAANRRGAKPLPRRLSGEGGAAGRPQFY
eukprot:364444-Chlamydomonas_euryale.AAC.11